MPEEHPAAAQLGTARAALNETTAADEAAATEAPGGSAAPDVRSDAGPTPPPPTDPAGGSDCTPTAAVDTTCDGIDDDCDGVIDDDFASACSGTGIATCAGGLLTFTSCSDGNPCNGEETCSGASGTALCQAGPAPELDDGNPCTSDACNATTGITHTPLLAGSACEDGDLCNGADACDGNGQCLNTGNLAADDGDPCTLSYCDPMSGPRLVRCSPSVSAVVSRVGKDWAFLVSDPNPPQTGVREGAVDAVRAGVLSGRILDREGAPLAGVSIAVFGHPELGTTTSRPDGSYDVLANGGGPVVLVYRLDGYLESQRRIQLAWGGAAPVADVALLGLDPLVTLISADEAVYQVARGPVVTDGAGTRQATLLVPPGTTATLPLADGSAVSPAELHVRATEYSLLALGDEAMPADLPPGTSSGYAVELSADEAFDAGASRVDFNQSAALFIENFRGIPVGTPVPAGSLDRARGQWIASNDGRVVRVLDAVLGVANLDADGNGSADSDAALAALGISRDERRELAALYPPGTSLWRIPIARLSAWDAGFALAPVAAACAPGPGCGGAELPAEAPRVHAPCSATEHSAPDCADPVLEQRVLLAGTPFALVYSSERALGQHAEQTLEIPITGSTALPDAVRGVDLEITIAGRVFRQSFSNTPQQSYTFVWDGKDALGRSLRGVQPVTIRRGHRYGALYQQPAAQPPAFAQASGVPLAGSPAAGEQTLWSVSERTLQAAEPAEPGLGGWALSVHHSYDPLRHVILRGDGGIEDPGAKFGASITTEAGTGLLGAGADGVDPKRSALGFPSGLAAAPDGSLYIADTLNDRVRRLAPDGSLTTISGEGAPPNLIFNGSNEAPVSALNQIPGWTPVSGDNWQPRGGNPDPFEGGQYFFAGVAALAELRQDVDVSGFAPAIDAGQQSFSFEGYVLSFAQDPADSSRIVLEYRDAANGSVLSSYDSGAIAQFVAWRRLTDTRSAPPGTRFVRVRLIAARAGGSNNDGYFDGLSLRAGTTAVASLLSGPRGLAVGRDGSLYVADTGNNRVLELDATGRFVTVAGTGQAGFSGDGGLALAAQLSHPRAVAAAPDGAVYIADSDNFRIRKVSTSGVITTLSGTGNQSSGGNGSPASLASLGVVDGLALAPDGSLLFAESSQHRIRALGSDGIVRPFAGTGTSGFAGDGALATSAQLAAPTSVFVAADGRTFIADSGNSRVRLVDTDGRIRSFSGNGTANAAGDNGPALAAGLHSPGQLALSPDGALHVADTENQRIRRISAPLPGASNSDLLVPSANGQEIYRFSSDGLHQETLRSLNGAILYSFAYDGRKRLLAVRDEVGRVTTLERNSTGDVTAIVGPYGQRTTLDMNAGEYLASVTDPEGASEQFGYGADGLLTRRSDALGNVARWTYDSLGRLTQAVDATGATTDLSRSRPSPTRSRITLTTPLGRSTTEDAERFADGSEQSSSVQADGSASRHVQHADGTSSASALDGTQYGTSVSGDPRWGTAVPVTSRVQRLPSGLERVVLRTREVTLRQATDPFSVRTETQTEVVNGRSYRLVFDAPSGSFTLTSPTGRKLVRSVDSSGRTTRIEIDGLTPLDFSHDPDGRLASSTQGERTAHFDYFVDGGARGYLASVIDPLGQELDTDRDGIGRVIRQTDEGIPTTFSFEPTGQLASVAEPGRPAQALAYTARHELASYTPPAFDSNDPSTGYRYDADGALVAETRPGAVSVELDYDAAGRLSRELAPTGTLARDYYAPNATGPGTSPGKLAQLSGPGNISLGYSYDGELQTGASVSGDVSFALDIVYDANFAVVRQTLSAAFGSRSTAFGYDSDLLLTCASPSSCSPAGAAALNLTRDPRHGLVTELLQGRLDERWSYDAFGALASQTLESGAGVIARLEYDSADGERDALGRITRQTESFGGATHAIEYAYDLLGELTDVSVDGQLSEHYEYDFTGNRSLAQTPTATTSSSYDVQDRLQNYGPYRYVYTPNGELLAKVDTFTGDITEYSYDAFGNLLAVDLPDDRQIDYVTDGLGRRLGKKIDGLLVAQWLYAGQQLVAELDGAGNLVASFVYASRSLVPDYLQRADGSIYRILCDQRGSVRLVLNVNDANDVLFRADYSAFGEPTVRAGSPNALPFGFAGGVYDPDTGLVRVAARDYEPASGRWTTKDPLHLASGQANPYVRLGNDPVNPSELGQKWPAGNPAAALREAATWGTPSGLLDALGASVSRSVR